MKSTTDKRLIFLNPAEIIPPKTARTDNDRYRLFLLSESIREYGLLIPVTVCKCEYGYTVISGERRIKASILAGLKKIPCIVDGFCEDPELFRAAECLLGYTRDAFEEADLLNELCDKYSPSKVASFLSFTTYELEEILKVTSLSKETKEKAREYHLSMLQLIHLCGQSKEERKEYFEEFAIKEIKPSNTEEKVIEKKLPPIKDARFLVNSVKQLTDSLCSAGVPITFKQKETDAETEIKIRIKKNFRNPQMTLF